VAARCERQKQKFRHCNYTSSSWREGGTSDKLKREWEVRRWEDGESEKRSQSETRDFCEVDDGCASASPLLHLYKN